MHDSTKNITDLSDKILNGVQKAVNNLIRTNAAKGEDMVIGEKDGSFKIVPAMELLTQSMPKSD